MRLDPWDEKTFAPNATLHEQNRIVSIASFGASPKLCDFYNLGMNFVIAIGGIRRNPSIVCEVYIIAYSHTSGDLYGCNRPLNRYCSFWTPNRNEDRNEFLFITYAANFPY